MRERDLQRRCLDWVNDGHRGRLVAVNVHGGGATNRGFPDLVVFGGGHAVLVELKLPGRELRPEQEHWRRRFARTGTPCLVVTTMDEFEEAMRREFPYEAGQEV